MNRYLYVPLLYCYRHFLEVATKDAIAKLEPLAWNCGGPAVWINAKVLGSHDLEKLWRTLEELICSVFGESERNTDPIASVRGVVMFFARIDSSGQVLRYRYSKKSPSPNETKLPEHGVDVSKLREKIREVDGFFTGLTERISASTSEP